MVSGGQISELGIKAHIRQTQLNMREYASVREYVPASKRLSLALQVRTSLSVDGRPPTF